MLEVYVTAITEYLRAQPPSPVFVPGTDTLENTAIMLALIALLLAFHKIMNVPIVCMLGGLLCSAMAVFETDVYYFPYMNLLVILTAVYIAYDGFEQISDNKQ